MKVVSSKVAAPIDYVTSVKSVNGSYLISGCNQRDLPCGQNAR